MCITVVRSALPFFFFFFFFWHGIPAIVIDIQLSGLSTAGAQRRVDFFSFCFCLFLLCFFFWFCFVFLFFWGGVVSFFLSFFGFFFFFFFF